MRFVALFCALLAACSGGDARETSSETASEPETAAPETVLADTGHEAVPPQNRIGTVLGPE